MLCFQVCAVLAQGLGSSVQPDTAMDRKAAEQGQGWSFFGDTSFLVVPIPISNPTIGSGGALAASMFFKTEENAKSSLIGAGGFYTSNGSWGGAAMTDIYFDENRYHAKASTGYASVSYDFYGIGSHISDRHVALTQSGGLLQGSFQSRVAPGLYVGGQFRYMNIRTRFDLPDIAGELLDEGGPLSRIRDRITTIGLVATYDSRNKDYAPTGGTLIEAAFDLGQQDFVFRNNFVRATAAYNRYDALADDLVLASRFSLCSAEGKVPIFDLCMFGSSNDLRGYAVGRYQDKAMFAWQEELRWHAFWRVGFVAFAGVGSVAPAINQFGKLLASGGVGVRFLASRETGINVGIDGAFNVAGEGTYYIQVGEAF